MFDTIRMKTYLTIDPELLPSDRTKSTHNLDKETGEVRSTYQVRDDFIHFFRYSKSSELLVIEVSIPKFLFGQNVRTVSESHISEFWSQLHDRLFLICRVQIQQSSWIVERLDVCKNFHVGNQIGEYIGQIAKKHVPYCKPHLIGCNETVEFKTAKNKRVITCYDKHLECMSRREPADVIEQALGILRFEMTPSKHDLVTYSPGRRAIDSLTTHFFNYMMDKPKVLRLLKFPETIEPTLDFGWLSSQHSIMQIETMIGFKVLLDSQGEASLKLRYNPQTFASRKRLLRTYSLQSNRQLADLI